MITVLEPGLQCTVQDAGRPGWERFGLPPGGAMDPAALRTGNRLCGNLPGLAGLEFFRAGPVLWAGCDITVALTGVEGSLEVGTHRFGAGRSVLVRAGERVRVKTQPGGDGCWGYLAFAGGLEPPAVLGSRSTLVRAGLGGLEGRVLVEGDSLPLGFIPDAFQRAGSRLAGGRQFLKGGQTTSIRVTAGPQEGWFSVEALQSFCKTEYHLSDLSDRMGYRLEGPPLTRSHAGELLSQGTVPGAIQIPPDGQPVVMMADRPTTGGYPIPACVIRADLARLAQCLPGEAKVRFVKVSREEALQAWAQAAVEPILERDDLADWMQG